MSLQIWPLACIGVSLALALLRGSFLSGSVVALGLVVLAQVYLPGYLLARVMGKTGRHLNPIVQFAWILGCGLAVTICLGAAARLLDVRLEIYLVVLHMIMVVLALIRSRSEPVADRWTLKRPLIPLYSAVVVCCLITLFVSYASRYRFFGFEDQAIFISLADWIVHNSDDPMLRSRQVGVLNGDTRFDTDGWTYNHAAWVYSSGVPAAQLIWYDLNALFVWTVPLVVFAMAYEITQREEAAAWSVVGLTLASLLTLDNIVYGPAYYAFGRFALFQINTLRQASLSFMLPLTFLVGFAYLRTWQRRDLLLIFLFGLALATMHPFPIMIFLLSMGVTAGLQWLFTARSQKVAQLLKLLPLAVVFVGILALPLVQRLNRPNIAINSNFVNEEVLETSETPTTSGSFLVLPRLPLLGSTYILKPDAFFYHAVIAIATMFGLLHLIGVQRNLTAQYIFGSTALVLMLVFTPGITEIFNKFASSVGVYLSIFMLPVALILGVSFDYGMRLIGRKWQTVPAWVAAGLAVAVMLALLFEPFPITASAGDQLRAFNAMQGSRAILPFQDQVIKRLQGLIDPQAPDNTILTVPADLTNLVIEDIPRTLITGGRLSRNTARAGDSRIYNHSSSRAPWLDNADIDYLRQWGVNLLVVETDSTRLPQLLLQPERFEVLDTSDGYFVFRVQADSETKAVDALFGEMNSIYGTLAAPRWTPHGFELPRPADAEAWRGVAESWDAVDDTSDLAVYGQAFTYTMLGDDAQALPLWEQLSAKHPDIFLFQSATAHTRRMIESSPDSIQPLLNVLDSGTASAKVLAVVDLLDPFFLYLVNDEQLDQMIAAAEAEPVVWKQLADFDQPDTVRERVALLMSRGRYETAAAWSEQGLLPTEVSPQDLLLRASVALADGDLNAALSVLNPTLDNDYFAPNRRVHPDRWTVRSDAWKLIQGMMFELTVDLIYTNQIPISDVRAANVHAPDQARTSFGEIQRALRLYNARALYVIDPIITQTETQNGPTLRVEAIFNNPHVQPYPVQSIRIVVTDGNNEYANVAHELEYGLMARQTFEVDLPSNVPELKPARVIIEPRYDDTVTFPPAVLDVVLNRPDSAEIPADAIQPELQFGDQIRLDGYQAEHDDDSLNVTLYWETATPLPENYQVFVHVIDTNGQVVAQRDAAPVDNRYPTSQWRTETVIEDQHTINFDEPLPAGDYTVRVGMYPLSDTSTRLSVQPVDERVANDTVQVYAFSVP